MKKKTKSEKNSDKNLAFLKEIGEQTVLWHDTTLRTNMSGSTIEGEFSEFTKFRISTEDFEKILSIIKEELLLVMPKETMMGYIEGYDIRDLDMNLLLRFGKENLPENSTYTLKKLFRSLVRSKDNLKIHAELEKEEKIWEDILPRFEDYCYGNDSPVSGDFFEEKKIRLKYSRMIEMKN